MRRFPRGPDRFRAFVLGQWRTVTPSRGLHWLRYRPMWKSASEGHL